MDDFPNPTQLAQRYAEQAQYARAVLEPLGYRVVYGKFGIADLVIGSYDLDIACKRATLLRPSEKYRRLLQEAFRLDAEELFLSACQAFRDADYLVDVVEDTEPLARGPPVILSED